MADPFPAVLQIVFFATVGLLVVLERVRPMQRETVAIAGRWTANIGLFVIAGALAAIALPGGIYGVAQAQDPGGLDRLGIPTYGQIALTFLLLDGWRYWEHRALHWAPLLWRLHLVHHSDTHVDVTTAERHHPLESILSTAVMMGFILACGLPPAGLAIYLVAATVVSLGSHANLRLPAKVDRLLRGIVVTPRVHLVHHSDLKAETDSNYGTVLTLWDRLFGTYVDPDVARIPHLGLEYFHRAPDTGLARALQQPFLYRAGMAYPARESPRSAPSSGSPALSQNWKNALLGGLAGCALVMLVLWPTVRDLTALWAYEAYQYAWLVVPMMAYMLAWDRREQTLAADPRPDFSGVFLAAGGAALWSVAALVNIEVGKQVALVLALHGVAMAMLGWRGYWRLFPALAMLFLWVPSGDLLQPFLRRATLESIEWFAVLAGLPHRVDGFLVHIGSQRYIVSEGCSGLAYVTLSIFLSYSFGLLLYRSLFRILGLTLLGAFLGFFSNVLRVNAIVTIDWLQGSQMDLTGHGHLQWVALFVALGLLFFVLSRLKPEASPSAYAAPPAQPRALRRASPVLAGVLVLLIVGSFHALPIDTLRNPGAARHAPAPGNVGQWMLASPRAAWTISPDKQTESLVLTYRRHDEAMQVRILETRSPIAKLSPSQLAPAETQWQQTQIRSRSACIDSRCLPLLHATWQRTKSRELRHVFYTYSIGDYATDSVLALRLAHGWHRLTRDGNAPRLTALTFADDTVPSLGDVAAALLTVQSALRGAAP